MQRLCHQPELRRLAVPLSAFIWIISFTAPAHGEPPANDYPTQARVEYVNECVANHGDSLSTMYQCSCVIDRIAKQLSYDDFVEGMTFARYAGLPGEGGAIFRDSERAKDLAKRYRQVEGDAYLVCGIRKN